MKRVLTYMMVLGFASVSTAGLSPFTSDGCSAPWDGFSGEFLSCCVKHDFLYWKGGSRTERAEADKSFEACMQEKASTPIAWIYYWGVRAGGGQGFHLSWSWGYGWSPARGYRNLSNDELADVQKMTPDLSLKIPLIRTVPRAEDHLTEIKEYIREKYKFVPSTVGEIYRFVHMDGDQMFQVDDYNDDHLFLITRADCPQGYYIADDRRFSKNHLDLTAYGSCSLNEDLSAVDRAIEERSIK